MNTRQIALACASLVAAVTLAAGCNDGSSGDTTGTPGGTATSAPAKPSPTAQATDGSKNDPNWAFLQEIDPCMLLTDNDMNTLFKTSGFGHEGGGYVERFYGRHCVFTGSNAYIDTGAASIIAQAFKNLSSHHG